jgi:hypothetical protein
MALTAAACLRQAVIQNHAITRRHSGDGWFSIHVYYMGTKASFAAEIITNSDEDKRKLTDCSSRQQRNMESHTPEV